ncbi:MAG: hypothetical protein IPH93_15240 [Saprospiraceae bacterium]|nr:hypothetical protein [Saprospiraceae bacterium]
MSELTLFHSIPSSTLSAKQFQALEMALINPNLDAKACNTIVEKFRKLIMSL